MRKCGIILLESMLCNIFQRRPDPPRPVFRKEKGVERLKEVISPRAHFLKKWSDLERSETTRVLAFFG